MNRPFLAAVFVTAVFAGPTSAIAATVGEEPAGSGLYVLRAASGETNAVYSNGGFPPAFRELGAPLRVNEPCAEDGGFVTCPSNPELFLRDRADIAWFRTDFGATVMHGGSGDDDLLAGAPLDARAEGESGDDVIDVSSGLTGSGDGGSGDDRISGGGPTDGASILSGGSDNDLLAHAGSSVATLDGGSGRDRVVAGDVFGSSQMTGGGGNDILTFAAGAAAQGVWTIDAGSGNDIVTGHPALDIVHGRSGHDRIDVAGGGADTVDCGSGIDIAWIDADDTVATDCELQIKAPAPRFSQVEAARSAAATLIARPHPFP